MLRRLPTLQLGILLRPAYASCSVWACGTLKKSELLARVNWSAVASKFE
jgi:hypothetical protein